MTETSDSQHLDDALHRAEEAIAEAKVAEQAVEAVGGLPSAPRSTPETQFEFPDASPEPATD